MPGADPDPGSARRVREVLAGVYADEWGRIVASLIRLTGDWDLAEECAQDAFARALERWPADGVPAKPGAWLTTTARNRALDRLRRNAVEAGKLREVAGVREPGPPAEPETAIPDDRLLLMFTCCHPALGLEAQVALTLRTLAGLSTGEIARAFLVPEKTMAQRLVRAKGKVRNAGIPFRVPPDHLLPERTGAVLAVLYLLFNEGYSAATGPGLVRVDLCREAIRLARVLATLMPDEPEALGLLALMLLQDSRSGARLDSDGEFVPLEACRTAAPGMPTRSAKDCPSWSGRCAVAGPARTRSRPPSPRAMPELPAHRTPTGPRSPCCTRSWGGWRRARWSS